MQYTYFGNTGLMISKMALGTMRMDLSDKELMFKVLDKAYDEGINFFDTADMYGRGFAKNLQDPYDGSGRHSELLGEWITKSKCRDEIIVSSKVRWPLKLMPNNEGLSRTHIIKSVNRSLMQLNSNWLDILYIHGDANNVNFVDVMRTMDDLQSAFKINYLGASNLNAYRVMEGIMLSKQQGLIEISTLQTKYSLLERSVFEREHQFLARDMNLGILCYGVLSEGFLSGLYQKDQSLPNKQNAKDVYDSENKPQNWAIIECLNEISSEHGVKQGQIAIAWAISNEYVDCPLLGVSSLDQLDYSLEAINITLTNDQQNRLNEVSKQNYPWWHDVNSRDYVNLFNNALVKYKSRE